MWLCGLWRPKRPFASNAATETCCTGYGNSDEGQEALRRPVGCTAASVDLGNVSPTCAHPVIDGLAGPTREVSTDDIALALCDEKHEEIRETDDTVLGTVLNQLCYPVTLFDDEGLVVLQNDASRRLWGDLLTEGCSTLNKRGMATPPGPGCPSPLNIMFAGDKDAFLEALAELEEGRVWRGLLQVPAPIGLPSLPTTAPLAVAKPGSTKISASARAFLSKAAAAAVAPMGCIAAQQSPMDPSLLTTNSTPRAAEEGQSSTASTVQPPQEGLGLDKPLLGSDVGTYLDISLSITHGGFRPSPAQSQTNSDTKRSPSKAILATANSIFLEPIAAVAQSSITKPAAPNTPSASPLVDPMLSPPAIATSIAAAITEPPNFLALPSVAASTSLECPVMQPISDSVEKGPTQTLDSSLHSGVSRSQHDVWKVPGATPAALTDAAGAQQAASHRDVSSSILGLTPGMIHSGSRSWGSFGHLSNDQVMRLGSQQMAPTIGNSAAGLTSLMTSGATAGPSEACASAVGSGSSGVLMKSHDVNKVESRDWQGSTNAVSPLSKAAGVMSLMARGEPGGMPQEIPIRQSLDTAVGVLGTSWPRVHSRVRRSMAVYTLGSPSARAEADTSVGTGAGAGSANSGPGSHAQQHLELLAEGLTTSALRTLVRGGSRRLPRRNMSATVLMPNRQGCTPFYRTLLQPQAEDRHLEDLVSAIRTSRTTGDEVDLEAQQRAPSGGKDGSNHCTMSTIEKAFGITTDYGNVMNTNISMLSSGNINVLSSLLSSEVNVHTAIGGGLQCESSGVVPTIQRNYSLSPAAVGSVEAITTAATLQSGSFRVLSGPPRVQQPEPGGSGAFQGTSLQASLKATTCLPLSSPSCRLRCSNKSPAFSPYNTQSSVTSTTTTSRQAYSKVLTESPAAALAEFNAMPAQPTSAMERLLDMAFTVASGASASASRPFPLSRMGSMVNNESRTPSPALLGSFHRPRDCLSSNNDDWPGANPSSRQQSSQQPPAMAQQLTVILSALSGPKPEHEQVTATLFRAMDVTPHPSPSASKSTDSIIIGVRSQHDDPSPALLVAVAAGLDEEAAERASNRTSCTITASDMSLVRSSRCNIQRAHQPLVVGNVSRFSVAADDSSEGPVKHTSEVQVGLTVKHVRAVTVGRSEVTSAGLLQVAKLGPLNGGGQRASGFGGLEITFGTEAPRMSTGTLEGLVDTLNSSLASGKRLAQGSNIGGGGFNTMGRESMAAGMCSSTVQALAGVSGGVMQPSSAMGKDILSEMKPAEEPKDHHVPVVPFNQWHEVTLTRFKHPTLERPVIMMVQNDVSARVWAERQIAQMMVAEHSLLENIFPIHVIQHIAAQAAQAAAAAEGAAGAGQTALSTPVLPPITGGTFQHLATSHSALTVLFCDIQGFTSMCNVVKPATVMAFLNDLYTRLDAMLDGYGVYKVETIGDCYVAAGGLMKVDPDTGAVTVRSDDVDPQHAHRTVQFAKALLCAAAAVRLPTTGEPVWMRVGIHSGPAMSGVVGTRMPRFCLFGDTINTASRMESTGLPGAIHVSQATRDLVPEEDWMPTGGVEAKGKGLLKTYLLKPYGDM